MDQDDRNKVISEYKKSDMNVLVATDVAARGLDIPAIKTVVNYDVARDIDTHTHRIGRTGRAGEHGTAYTLVLNTEKEFCPHLVRNLESSDQQVPQALLDIAEQVPWFKSQRSKGGAKKPSVVGSVSGSDRGNNRPRYRERPGLGSGSSNVSSSSTISKGASSYVASGATKQTTGQTDRVASLKQAFASSFKSQFVSASEQTHLKPSTAAVPSTCVVKKSREMTSVEEEGGKKKSRWDK